MPPSGFVLIFVVLVPIRDSREHPAKPRRPPNPITGPGESARETYTSCSSRRSAVDADLTYCSETRGAACECRCRRANSSTGCFETCPTSPSGPWPCCRGSCTCCCKPSPLLCGSLALQRAAAHALRSLLAWPDKGTTQGTFSAELARSVSIITRVDGPQRYTVSDSVIPGIDFMVTPAEP